MDAEEASQAMPQASGVSGTASRVTIARMAWVRRIANSLPYRQTRIPDRDAERSWPHQAMVMNIFEQISKKRFS
jgi:hypothetical protein